MVLLLGNNFFYSIRNNFPCPDLVPGKNLPLIHGACCRECMKADFR